MQTAENYIPESHVVVKSFYQAGYPSLQLFGCCLIVELEGFEPSYNSIAQFIQFSVIYHTKMSLSQANYTCSF